MTMNQETKPAVSTSITKVAVVCLPGFQSFLTEIVTLLNQGYDTRTCFSDSPQEIAAAVDWADVVWLEWANALTIGLTQNAALLEGKYVICRLHSYEVFEDSFTQIQWSRIDHLICVAPHILEIAKKRIPDLASSCPKISIIPNGIDVASFPYRQRQKGFHLAFLGSINYKKGPLLLLQLLKALVDTDPRYHLTIAGRIQDARYGYYLDHMIGAMELSAHVRFDGWIADVGQWLTDKDYIICTSLLEGHPLGLMEAMACGIKPVIHNFVGAQGIYPRQYLWNTIAEGIDQIRTDEYRSSDYRRWVQERYDLEIQLAEIEKAVAAGQSIDAGEARLPHDRKSRPIAKRSANPQKAPRTDQSPSVPQPVMDTLKRCVQPGMRVLDVGCGAGGMAPYMRSLGANVTEIDVSRENIAKTGRIQVQGDVGSRNCSPSQIEAPSTFDLVTVIGALPVNSEDELDLFVESIRRHLTPMGVVYLHVKDGRYLRHLNSNRVDEGHLQAAGYPPEAILGAFARCGLQVYYINLYGQTLPVEFNEYLFTTQAAIQRTLRTSPCKEI